MASLHEKVEAELEQMDQVLRELPGIHRINHLSGLELAGTASLLSSWYHGVENILKQGLLASGVALPSGAAWHRDLLQSACAQGMISTALRDGLVPFMGFRHFFTHAYGFDLDPERLLPLVRDIHPVCSVFRKEAKRIASTLEKNRHPKRQIHRSRRSARG